MSGELRPALTPEDWGKRSHNNQETGVGVWLDEDGLGTGCDPFGAETTHVRDPGDLAAVIALANAALPDDSPYKITHDLVDFLRSAAHDAEARYDNTDEVADLELARQLERWVGALGALLPPR